MPALGESCKIYGRVYGSGNAGLEAKGSEQEGGGDDQEGEGIHGMADERLGDVVEVDENED